MLADTILILFISFCTALLSEGTGIASNILLYISITHMCFDAGILYLLVYRTDHYKRLKSTVEKQSKRCEYTAPQRSLESCAMY